MIATTHGPDAILECGGRRRVHPRRVGLLLLLLGCIGSSAAWGELIVLRGGHVLKARAYAVKGDEATVTLESGGTLVLPLLRVERVVEDEIVAEPEPLPQGAYPLRFSAAQPVPSTPYGDLIYGISRRHGMNPELVAAVIRAESAFDPQAVSPKGARGLMQLMPATAERFGVAHEELFDPARNIEAGTGYLDWLTEKFDGELELVLAAYNAGEGIVARYDGVPPYRETLQYIGRIYDTLDFAESGR